jgi:hypothetical protein
MSAFLAGLAVLALGCVIELALCIRACLATWRRSN